MSRVPGAHDRGVEAIPQRGSRELQVTDGRSARWRTWAAAHREPLAGVAALGGVLGIAALSYWWTRAPLYNPSNSIDPWLYTALFVNFDQIYEHFSGTYYAARLPWVVPGRVLYGVLPVDVAYWILHALAFVGGVAALFVLLRRYLGLAVAVVGAGTLALTPIYWNAQYWDYIDGVTLTYLLAGLCFGLPLAVGRLRAVSLGAAGVFVAAAVTTNLFAALVVLIYPILYLFLQQATGARQRFVLALKDVAAVLVGAAALLVALGYYARANGGPFVFFEPQIDLIRSGVVGDYKKPGYQWLRAEPSLLAPVFLIAVAAPILALGHRQPPFRFAAGSTAGLMFLTAVIYGWEFLAGGAVLEHTYYFSYFAISIALTLASIAALVVSLARSNGSAQVGVAAAATVAAVLALGLIYRTDRREWTGQTGMKISLAVLAGAALVVLGFVLVRRTSIRTAGAVAAAGALAFACHFAINSSAGTYRYSRSDPINGSLYRAALDHVAFVRRSTVQDDLLPAFWYREATNPEFRSIQSTYYYAYTYLDLKLPNVTRQMRDRLDLLEPTKIVMLCETRNCGGGLEALRRAGYSYAEESVERISRGRVRLWAVLLRSRPSPSAT